MSTAIDKLETSTATWGGDLAAEAEAAVKAVQRAMQLCQALACDMAVVDASGVDSSKTMEACDVTAGVSFIKPGDSTPVTAADFAIQGLVSSALRSEFPADRFMGEEDAADLRDDADLCALALRLCSQYGGDADEEAFLSAVDRGLEPPRGEGERCWVLDPIDGTKGFMTGQGYVIGLALLSPSGEALCGVMGVPNEQDAPPIVCAVKGHGARWWPAVGDAPLAFEPKRPEWADATPSSEVKPPWLLSPQSERGACVPFGVPGAGLQTVCCGAMIKYYEVAAGRVAGFIQYEESLKAWDHACGLICISESGGVALDGAGEQVLFDGRQFHVQGGIVCTSAWTSPEVRQALVGATQRPVTLEGDTTPAAAVEQPDEAFDGAPPHGFSWGGVY